MYLLPWTHVEVTLPASVERGGRGSVPCLSHPIARVHPRPSAWYIGVGALWLSVRDVELMSCRVDTDMRYWLRLPHPQRSPGIEVRGPALVIFHSFTDPFLCSVHPDEPATSSPRLIRPCRIGLYPALIRELSRYARYGRWLPERGGLVAGALHRVLVTWAPITPDSAAKVVVCVKGVDVGGRVREDVYTYVS
ncbi:hypothetical protein DFH06DRAFT_1333830 [Mycena polygramma]|nr:hypothetical protein DFH06DRAFT_1333830 [Mycena polygramma]